MSIRALSAALVLGSVAAPYTVPIWAADADDVVSVVPFQDLETADLLKLNRTLQGDLDAMRERRFIRALVLNNRTTYYLDGAEQRGIAYESLLMLEQALRESTLQGQLAPRVVIIPTPRDRLLPALAAGYGDMAIGAFTIRSGLEDLVDFSEPLMSDVRHVVVAGVSESGLNSIENLSGRSVHVRRSSSFYEDLGRLNEKLKEAALPPIIIETVDETLEDEDILQMVDAGIIPVTVSNEPIAEFWAQQLDGVEVLDNLVLRNDGRIAWAFRKGTPQLKDFVDGLIRKNRAGTLFGNIMLKRYLGSAERLRNPRASEDLQRFRAVAPVIRKYAEQYGLPWPLIAAQAYQESRLNQDAKSTAGAVGVMQINPATAAEMGFEDVTSLESNVEAGVKYLRFIVGRYFMDEPMDRLNQGLFALASYNAGPARVAKLRSEAANVGLDPNRWFNHVELIAARNIGRETVDYVSNIYKYYTVYQSLVDAEG